MEYVEKQPIGVLQYYSSSLSRLRTVCLPQATRTKYILPPTNVPGIATQVLRAKQTQQLDKYNKHKSNTSKYDLFEV